MLSQTDLERLEEHWRANRARAASRGLPYLITIVPNKGAVYPGKLPYVGRFVSDQRMLQQVREVANVAGVAFLDLTDVLMEGQKQSLVWYPRDTHWNSYGAWLGYNRIAQEVTERFELEVAQIPHDELSFVRTPRQMDIARLMGLGEAATEEVNAARVKERPKVLHQVMTPEKGFMYFEMDNPGAPVVLATHDSFIWSILPFLQYGYSKIILISAPPLDVPWEMVDRYKPDIILP